MFLDLIGIQCCSLICWLNLAQGQCWSYVVGYKPVVEPLSQPVLMLIDHTRTRQGKVARLGISQGNIIFATVRARWECVSTSATHTVLLAGLWLNLLESLLHLRPLVSTSHAHYSNQNSRAKRGHLCPGPIMHTSHCFFSFHSRPSTPCQARSLLLFTSIWQIMGCLPSCMAMEGAPTAYIMEYLDPCTWQTWLEFLKFDATAVNRTQLQEALDSIIEKLESKNYVHGDLRSNNIVIRTDVIEKSVDLKVIDFDWAGEAGQVRYPAERNRDIWWPGEAGGTNWPRSW